MKKIGIFGGTFDPPHLGHLNIAKEAYEALGLDEVLFMPNGVPAYKLMQHEISGKDIRCNMVSAMIEGLSWCRLSTFEIEREGNTYTADTLKLLTDENPDEEYYIIVGSDSFVYMDKWHEPDVVFSLAKVVVYLRKPDTVSKMNSYYDIYKRKFNADVFFLKGDYFDISSTDIRNMIRNKENDIPLMDERVLHYIVRNKIYE